MSYRVSFRINPCAERASACQARACIGAEGFIHSEESVKLINGPVTTTDVEGKVCLFNEAVMTERRLLSFPHRLDWVGGFWPQTPITPTLWAQQGSHRQQGSDHPFRFSWTGSHAPPHLPVPEPSAEHAGGLQAPNCGCVGLGHSVDWAIQVLQGAFSILGPSEGMLVQRDVWVSRLEV